jgi:hypothetical protein
MGTMFSALVALSVLAVVINRLPWRVTRVRLQRQALPHRVIHVLACLTILLPGLAQAHGNVAIEEDPCVRRVGGNLVHFNAYQPQNEAKAQYCTEIPGEGATFLVVDLVDPGLRNMPVGLRVVRGLGETETAEDQTVAYWPPAIHRDGVVRGEALLAKGLYKLIIMPEGVSPLSYLIRVQQIDYSTMARKAIGPLTVLFLLLLIGYELSKSRRFKKRQISGHS